jgi:malate permease and related proteins
MVYSSVFTALLEVVLPVIVVTLAGVLLGRFIKPDQAGISKITLFALSPALALDNLTHTEVRLGTALTIIVGYAIFEALMGVLTWFLGRDQPDKTRRSMVAGVITGNNGNFGLPISLFAFGRAGFELSLIVFTVSVFFTFVVTAAVLSGSSHWRSSLRAVFRLPLVWCALLGVGLNAFHTTFPTGIDRGIHLLAQAAIPMLLISLGVQIGSQGLPRLTGPIVVSSGLRLFLGPVVALIVGTLVGLSGLERGVLVLSAAMPTAINAFLLAGELGADARTVAGTVVVTTFGSVGTIAVIVSLLR